ncbi:MAG: hypothetical protein ACK4M6_14140 [Hyphomonas sp.]
MDFYLYALLTFAQGENSQEMEKAGSPSSNDSEQMLQRQLAMITVIAAARAILHKIQTTGETVTPCVCVRTGRNETARGA